MTTNDTAFLHAQTVLPGGVNSPVRAYRSVGGSPRFITSAQGATITDVAGRTYVDLVSSWGPALLGHAHPAVVDAVQQAAARGLSFGAPTVGEVELAQAIRARGAVRGAGAACVHRDGGDDDGCASRPWGHRTTVDHQVCGLLPRAC